MKTDAILLNRARRLRPADYLDKNSQVVWICLVEVVDKGHISRSSDVVPRVLYPRTNRSNGPLFANNDR
jgi:hypothetical protein